ncbi:hypothetical protein CupriaWKF_12525 [Cupriavidus sp. WKF15]|uniref:hypothetical protein n=1 Tax=Cupriavidus sp. WKF15 TaxID=3032282 RepID=UPI0023E143A4|nr:hypothetical protein [Cupriavidus sp. WKF15]WER45132.1 hypothetical protein CupriaWKF_12525 [Cupriavidus sp. WKF15]
MKTINKKMKNRTHFSNAFGAISIALFLSACGSGGGDQASAPASSPPAAPAQKPLACDVTTPPATTPAFGGKSTVAVCGNLFVDPAVASTQYTAIADAYHSALALDKAVYGSLQAAEPDVVVCGSSDCANYFAGPSQRNVTLAAGTFVQAGGYVAPRITIVLTSATWDRNQYVLAHERSHVEVAARLNGKHVPAWFDEGLATYVGGEPPA